MKLLVVAPISLEVGGGGEIDLLELIHGATARGHEVKVVNVETLHRGIARISRAEIARRLGPAQYVGVEPVRWLERLVPVPAVREWRRLGRLIEWADVTLCSPYLGCDFLVALLQRLRDRPVVYSQGNAIDHGMRKYVREAIMTLYNRYVERAVLRRSSGVRVWNRDDEAELRRSGVPNVIVLYPAGPPGAADGGASPGGPSVLPAPGVSFTFLIAGRMSVQKGLDVLAESLALLRRTRPDLDGTVCVCFAGTPELPPAFRPFAVGPRPWAVNLGLLSREQFVRAIASVDCVLMPSIYESFGMVAMEAHAAGKPVLGTAIRGLRDIVTDGETGFLVPPGDARALADALARCIRLKATDPAEWSRIGARARQQYVERFGEPARRPSVDAFYRLLEREGGAPPVAS
jgi:glycosyltransferase involved in cell wall biosynthesis